MACAELNIFRLIGEVSGFFVDGQVLDVECLRELDSTIRQWKLNGGDCTLPTRLRQSIRAYAQENDFNQWSFEKMWEFSCYLHQKRQSTPERQQRTKPQRRSPWGKRRRSKSPSTITTTLVSDPPGPSDSLRSRDSGASNRPALEKRFISPQTSSRIVYRHPTVEDCLYDATPEPPTKRIKQESVRPMTSHPDDVPAASSDSQQSQSQRRSAPCSQDRNVDHLTSPSATTTLAERAQKLEQEIQLATNRVSRCEAAVKETNELIGPQKYYFLRVRGDFLRQTKNLLLPDGNHENAWTTEKLDELSSSIPRSTADLTGAINKLRDQLASAETIQQDLVNAKLNYDMLYEKMKQVERILEH